MRDLPVAWRKSSRSHQYTGCVEVGRTEHGAAVRDTKDRAAGYLVASRPQWHTFVDALKADHFTD